MARARHSPPRPGGDAAGHRALRDASRGPLPRAVGRGGPPRPRILRPLRRRHAARGAPSRGAVWARPRSCFCVASACAGAIVRPTSPGGPARFKSARHSSIDQPCPPRPSRGSPDAGVATCSGLLRGQVLRQRGTWRYLPHAILATLGTVVLPLALVELIQARTGERSALLSVGSRDRPLGTDRNRGIMGLAAPSRRPGHPLRRPHDPGVRQAPAGRAALTETTRLLGVDPLSAEGVADRVQILERLARALDARDPFMVGHSLRVARNAEMMAGRMGLTPEQVKRVRIAALVHDAGKINTPTSILNKPSALTDEEFEIVKRHPGDGEKMLGPPGRPGDRGNGATPSRAPRREWLSRRSRRREHPAGRADHRRRRHLRRHHVGPPLPGAAQPARCTEDPQGRRRVPASTHRPWRRSSAATPAAGPPPGRPSSSRYRSGWSAS